MKQAADRSHFRVFCSVQEAFCPREPTLCAAGQTSSRLSTPDEHLHRAGWWQLHRANMGSSAPEAVARPLSCTVQMVADTLPM
jgi:hypothetical protein